MSTCSLDAVSSAIYTTLNVASLLALAPGGAGELIEQLTARPCVLYVVQERVVAGFGSGNKPGGGTRTLECDVRLHVFDVGDSLVQTRAVMSECMRLLADPPSVTGYGSWAIFWDDVIPLVGEIVAGVVVNELVANMRLMVSES